MSAPTPEAAVHESARPAQLIDGKGFVLSAPDHVPAIFGHDREVLWSEGESLLIVGPQGVGKTTVLQQLALRRAGVTDDELLGFPVAPDTKRLTLYLALDRPQQIARSFKRMVTDADEQKLGRLIVWKGPLPFNLVKSPEALTSFVRKVGEIVKQPIGTVCIDSLKDMASPLSSDEVGAAVARAIGGVVSQGIEIAASHHQRKATSENRKPNSLDDVYGSTWITAGAGSVVLLWGTAGDPLIELTHLKQPDEEVGPLELAHDHERGATTKRDRLDAWKVLQGATHGGTTAAAVAEALYGANPSRSQLEKARRKLERFVKDGFAARTEPGQIGESAVYRPTPLSGRVTEPDASRDAPRTHHTSSRFGSISRHAPVTEPERSGLHTTCVVDRDRERNADESISESASPGKSPTAAVRLRSPTPEQKSAPRENATSPGPTSTQSQTTPEPPQAATANTDAEEDRLFEEWRRERGV